MRAAQTLALLASIGWLAALLPIWPGQVAAGDDPVRPEQLQELRDALIQGFAENDWKLIELPLKGLGAAGEKGAALEQRLKDAYQEAALRMLPTTKRVQLEVSLLAARARTGDAAALKELHSYAEWDLDHFKDLKDAPNAWAKQDLKGLTAQLEYHTQSLMALARLSDAAVPGLAEKWLTSARPAPAAPPAAKSGMVTWPAAMDPGSRVCTARVNAAVKALQALDPQAGGAAIDKLLANPQVTRLQRLELCKAGLTGEGGSGPISAASFANRLAAEVDKLDPAVTSEEAGVLHQALMSARPFGGKEPDPALVALCDKIVDFAKNKATGEGGLHLQNMTRWYTSMRDRTKGQPPKTVKPPAARKDDGF
jgi:hypothetical protein